MKFVNKGFTLVELLIVVAVASVLAGVVVVAVNPLAIINRAQTSKSLYFYKNVESFLNFDVAGQWDFDDSNSPQVTDMSGRGNHGTINGVTYDCNDTPFHIVGKGSGKCAMNYAGGQSVSVPNSSSLDITSSITISLWVKTTQYQSSWSSPINKGGNCSLTQRAYDVGVYNGVWGISVGECMVVPSGADPNNAKFRIDDDKWHYLAFTVDGTKWKAYKDGILIIQDNRTTLPASTTSNLSLGTSGLSAKLDDIRIYKSALSALEVKKIYAESSPKYFASSIN